MNKGATCYATNYGRRTISPTERADAIVWLRDFNAITDEEKRAKKILTYFLCDNISAQAIAKNRTRKLFHFQIGIKECRYIQSQY